MTPAKDANRLPTPKIPEFTAAPRKKGKFFPFLISVLVIGVITAGLWVAVSAVIEKMRLSTGLRHIIEIVDTARIVAVDDRALGQNREDLLAVLERFGRIAPTGEANGLKTLTNPWDNAVVGLVIPPNHVRIETAVPVHVCRRMIGLFSQDTDALGVEEIDIGEVTGSWRPLYMRGSRGVSATMPDETTIASGCGAGPQTQVALIFGLR